jgi:Family of unknown function (DUF5706)
MRRPKPACQVSVAARAPIRQKDRVRLLPGDRNRSKDAMKSTNLKPAAAEFEEDEQPYLDHLEAINTVYYDQIKIADQKAAFIFTFILAFLISSAEGSGVFKIERYQTGSWPTVVLSAILALAVAVSLVSAILVVLPRHRAKATSLYWGAWSPENRQKFIAAHEARDPDYLFNEYLANIDNLAIINRAKYKHVGWAFRALIVAVVAYLLILMVGQP